MENNKISVIHAHKLLGLFPGRSLSKEEIQKAYRSAAKQYHPDSRSADSTPCAVSFRQCSDAREVLIRHYYVKRPAPLHPIYKTNNHARREQGFHLPSFSQRSRARKFTFALKATVLVMAVIDGFYQKKRKVAGPGR
jgi:curved DNA-binding protein CbpA